MKKILVAVVAVMWVLIGIQYLFAERDKEDKQTVQAFYEDLLSELPCKLEAVGIYGGEYLEAKEREELLIDLAEGMGIKRGYEITESYGGKTAQTCLRKSDHTADVELKVITTENRVNENELSMEQKLSACISLYQVSSGISEYRALLAKLFEEYETEAEITIQFQGTYEGSGL